MEITPEGIGLILAALSGLLGAFKIPEIIKYLRDRDKSKIEELKLHIEELEQEIKLVREQKKSNSLAHANDMERLKQERHNEKESHVVTKMHLNVIKSLIKNANLQRDEMLEFIDSLDSEEMEITSAKT